MRSLHSLDGEHMALIDGFGLTRVTLPNKVKTERKICDGIDATLTANEDRTQLLAWRSDWNSMHHLSFPELKGLTKIPRFRLAGFALHPDGQSFFTLNHPNTTPPRAVAERWTTSEALASSRALDASPATTRPALDLGGDAAEPLRVPRVIATRGIWTVLFDATLYVGDFGEDPARLRWRVPIAAPPGALMSAHPFEDGRVTLCAFIPRTRELRVARFDAEGRATVGTLTALAPPAVLTPDVVLHQTDEESVTRTDLSNHDAERFKLAAIDAGVGRPFGDGAAACLLPWHAESVIDLRTGASIARKLSDDDAAPRRFVRELARRVNALGAPVGLFVEVSAFDLDARDRRFSVSWECNRGEGTLLGQLIAGDLYACNNNGAMESVGGWRGGFGGLDLAGPRRPWDAAEVDDALAALEREGIPLLPSLTQVEHAFSFGASGDGAAMPPLFTVAGARRFASALLCALRRPDATDARGLRDGAMTLDASLDASTVAAVLASLPERPPRAVTYHALDLLSIVVAQSLAADSVAALVAIGRVGPNWRHGIGSIFERAVAWLAATAPDRDAFVARFTAACGDDFPMSFYTRRALKLAP